MERRMLDAPGLSAADSVLIDARALAALEAEVLRRHREGGHESGGLLVGPPGSRVVLDFLPSGDTAHRTHVQYTTDPEHLQRALERAHARHGGDVLGYAHSHPPGMGRPSEQDCVEAQAMLDDPEYRAMVDEVLLPIATVDPRTEAVSLHWYAWRGAEGLVALRAHVLPRWEAVESLERTLLDDGYTVQQLAMDADGLGLVVEQAGQRFVWVLGPQFPQVAPKLFRLEGDAPVDELEVPAHLSLAPAEALAEAPAEAPTETPAEEAPRRLGLVRDADGATYRLRQMAPLRSGPAGPPKALDFVGELLSRGEGLVDGRHLQRSRVVVVGCGSVGTAMAVQLLRAGVGGLTLIDPDVVAVSNLSRSDFELADVGKPKVEALQARCQRINPHLHVTARAVDVKSLSAEELRVVGTEHSLAVVAVDEPSAIRVLNARWRHLLPVVYPGVYELGSGGEVLFTRPPAAGRPGTPCLECVLREVRFGAEARPRSDRWDYTTGRLMAEPALVAQIAHVVSAATLIALALLSSGSDTQMARFLDPRYSALFVANQAGWIFEQPFQAVWAELERDPLCECGRVHAFA